MGMPPGQGDGFSYPIFLFAFAMTFADDDPAAPVVGAFDVVAGLPSADGARVDDRDGTSDTASWKPIYRPNGRAVTLKRGVMSGNALSGWLAGVRTGAQAEHRTVTVTLRNETGARICAWILGSAVPRRWTGDALTASAVSVQELVLDCATITMAA